MNPLPDYRAQLRSHFETKKKQDRRVTLKKMAEKMRVQSPYLSKVLKGKAHMSQDQLYLASDYLRLSEFEFERLQLLLDYSRSVVPARRESIERKIRRLEMKEGKTQEHIPTRQLDFQSESAAEYYLDPLFQVVHMFFSIPRYSRNPSLIARDLSVPGSQVQSVLERLQALKIIVKRADGSFESVQDHIHLPPDSSICRPHQHLVRLATMNRLQTLPPEHSYNLALTFSANREAVKKIRKLFLENFLKTSDQWIASAPCDDVFQMNFDLFSWS